MQLNWLILALLILSSCGRATEDAPYHDPRLRGLIGRTEELLAVDLSVVAVKLGHLPSKVLGECTIQGKFRTIIVNEDKFPTMSNERKLEVLLHESGHCALFKDHRGGLLEDGCPISIMSPYDIGPDDCLTTHFEYYITELRSKQ